MRRFVFVCSLIGVLAFAVSCGGGDANPTATPAARGAAETPVVTLTPSIAKPTGLPTTPTAPAIEGVQLIEPPAQPEGIAHDGRTLGNPDAPVTLVEWGDYT